MVKRAKIPFKTDITSLPSSDGSSEVYVKHFFRGSPRLHFVIVHGAIEYATRHQELIDFLLSHFHDVVITTFDHIGHGLSSGARAHIENFNNFLKDFGTVVDHSLKKFTDVRGRFVLSHSMGGLIVLRSLQENIVDESKFKGFIFSNPCIKPIVHFPKISQKLLDVFLSMNKKIHLPLIYKGNLLTHDISRANDFDTDNLISKFMTVSMADQIIQASERLIGTSYYIKYPCLFLISEQDKIVCPEASKTYVKGIDKKFVNLKIYPEKYHDLWNEDNRNDIFLEMKKWVDSHARSFK